MPDSPRGLMRGTVDRLKDALRPQYWRARRGLWQVCLRARSLRVRALRAGGYVPADAEPLRGFHASLWDWCSAWARRGAPANAFCREVDPGLPALRHVPNVAGRHPDTVPPWESPASVPGPPLFVAAIPGGRVHGDAGAAIAPDGRLLVDTCGIHPLLPFRERASLPIWRVRAFAPPRVLHGRVAVLAALHATHNYFHWMLNVLPRVELFRRGGVDLGAVDALVVNRPHLSFQRETLARLGLAGERLIFADAELHARADILLVTSALRFSGHRTPWVLAFLRREFLTPGQPTPTARTRLYVSRQDASHRRLLNEAECLAVLRPLGFETVTLSGRSVEAQAGLFAQAETIVAPHGAGLANLVFCRPGTAVVELCAPPELRTHYLEMSQALGLTHRWVIGEVAGSRRDFQVRPADLALALRSTGIGAV